MKEHITKGLIRKLTIGDLKTGMNYIVGQTVMGGSAKITDIIEDEAYFMQYNLIRYNVYVKRFDDGFTYLWKDFKNQPVAIEYNLNFEEYAANI
tara:strand:+ start:1086 stop:1367 length:282 start_codon:yes stop_codon:yes gene_type:complete